MVLNFNLFLILVISGPRKANLNELVKFDIKNVSNETMSFGIVGTTSPRFEPILSPCVVINPINRNVLLLIGKEVTDEQKNASVKSIEFFFNTNGQISFEVNN